MSSASRSSLLSARTLGVIAIAEALTLPLVPLAAGGHLSSINPFMGGVNVVFQGADTHTGHSGWYYTHSFDVCNDGESGFTEDGWFVRLILFNTPGEVAESRDTSTLNDNIGSNDCEPFTAQFHEAASGDYCCGGVQFNPTGSTHQDDDTTDNWNSDNDMSAVFNPDQTRQLPFAVYNPLGQAVTLVHTVEDLPGDWECEFEEASTYVEPGSSARILITVTAPHEITSWPDFEIWSRDSQRPGADQKTTAHLRSPQGYQDSCTDLEL